MATLNFLADDLDPKVTSLDSDVQPREFTWDDERYTLDLGPRNADRLQAALDDYEAAVKRAAEKFEKAWMEHAKPVEDRTPPARKQRTVSGNGKGSHKTDAATAEYLAEVRRWARAQGANVADRGRLNGEIIEAYKAGDKALIPPRYFEGDGPAPASSPASAAKAPQKPQTAPEPTKSDKARETAPTPA